VNSSVSADFAAADRAAREALARNVRDIDRMLAPKRGVAFVGSANVDEAARFQWARYGDVKIVIVNPRGGQAGDVPVYRSMLEVPDEIDLAVVRCGPRPAIQVIEDCGKRGVLNALVFTDGYAETGAAGAALEQELAEAARRAGVRIIGPNTNDNAFERYPTPANHRGGSIGLITQSGANGRSVVEGVAMGASFFRWVTTGNEVDLEAADFISWYARQPEVSTIALYAEGFKSPAKLRVALEEAMLAGKPVVMIKMGATARGALAAASHTGHLAGEDKVIQGLFAQYGVTRVDDVDELLETANLFSKLPRGTGPRCAMYTISGGTASLMAEQAEMAGVETPLFGPERQDAIHAYIPKNLRVANPVDNGGVFVMRAPQAERLKVLDLIAEDPAVDIVVFGLNAAYGPLSDRMGADVKAWAPGAAKPAVAIWTSVVTDTPGYADLVASGVPVFRSFKKGMRALAAYARWEARCAMFRPRAASPRPLTPAQTRALATTGVLGAAAAGVLLADAGVALASERLAGTPEEAACAAGEIGFPVALKLVSPAIPHKTDQGFVRLGVRDAAEARAVAKDLLQRGRAVAGGAVDGVLVQRQLDGGVEVIVGVSTDPQFGPALTIGAGGVHAEVMGDAAVRPLPVDEADVREMIASLRIAPLLAGVRGAKPADVDALVRTALAVADLALASGGRLKELDLNPVIVRPDGAVAVDALVVAGS
jgi:acyl-CoA synthetase (NDP forming)